jgi:predicted DNA-binding transcriptional regulator AlpA
MITFSTRQVAKKLGLSHVALSHYIKTGKIPEPQIMNVGGRNVHVWTAQEIEHVRQLLPKIANGRKTRYKKKQSALSSQQPVKAKGKTKSKKKK